MKRIETEIYEPSPENPQKLIYTGQRTAGEVFEELQHRLEITGYLPDEYFLMDGHWRDGREIPKNASLFTIVDYGASEGIYLDIYLKWYDEQQQTSITTNFVTGKTLGESSTDMDRMYLIASAITKSFHSDGEHARYIRLGEAAESGGAVLHLNPDEQRLLIDSLIDTRSRMMRETHDAEQLLRRAAGGIIGFVNEVGARPLRISEYDRAVLAIQDGECPVLFEAHHNVPDKIAELLVQAAGRPGTVGRDMTAMLLVNAKDIPNDTYLNACKNAIATGDKERVLMLGLSAEGCVKDLDMGLYGEVIGEALRNHQGHIADAMLGQCTQEQIMGADPALLAEVLRRQKYQMADKLVESGINANQCASEIIHALIWNGNNRWYFKRLMDRGMEISSENYSAMQACMKTDNPEAAKILIDRGMDFDAYSQWAEGRLHDVKDETFEAVQEYWDNEQEQEFGQAMEMV